MLINLVSKTGVRSLISFRLSDVQKLGPTSQLPADYQAPRVLDKVRLEVKLEGMDWNQKLLVLIKPASYYMT